MGLDLVRNGYALWLPIPDEWAWNQQYRVAAQQAALAGQRMYDTDTCGSGPMRSAKLSLRVDNDQEWMRIANASPGPVGGYLFDPRGDLRAHMLYPCVVSCDR